MDARGERQRQLINELRSADDWVTSRELAARLGVTDRSIRDYVRAINAGSKAVLVLSDQAGYRLDLNAYRRYRSGEGRRRKGYDSPEQRLYYIVRVLVSQTEGADVFALGEQLSVSPATIEADLGKARELLREHQLRIERDHDVVRLQGPERQQRRLVRHLLLTSGQAALGGGLPDFESPRERARLRRLHELAVQALAECAVEVNEYVLNDLLLHLAIAAGRNSAGRQLLPPPAATGADHNPDDPLRLAAEQLASAVNAVFEVSLPEADVETVRTILATRANAKQGALTHPGAISSEALEITREALREVSGQYMLDLYDEATVVGLALHVQNLIGRAAHGRSLDTPLGPAFRNMHPLIHELALLCSREIERRTGIEVSSGEVDFLAFHLGNQVQRQMNQGPPVTITVVAPRYGQMHIQLAQRLSRALQDQAVVQDVVTSLTHDWDTLTSDLIVSVIDIEPGTAIPVLRVSPFLTEDDVHRVVASVRAERARAMRATLRANLISLLDPALFHSASHVSTKLDALALLSSTLEREGYVQAGFLNDVLDRERRSATAFGGQFAIPHSLYMDATKTGIAVLVADTPIPWGPSAVRLVMMFAVSPEGRPVFRDVLDELIEVLSEPANIAALLDQGADHHTFVRSLITRLES